MSPESFCRLDTSFCPRQVSYYIIQKTNALAIGNIIIKPNSYIDGVLFSLTLMIPF